MNDLNVSMRNRRIQASEHHIDNSNQLDNLQYESYTRLVSTHNTVISDDVGTNIAVENDVHISKSLIFGNFKISATTFTIHITDPITLITIQHQIKEILIHIDSSISTVSTINFKCKEESNLLKNCKIIIVNESQYNIQYSNSYILAKKECTVLQMVYIFNNRVYLGYKSSVPYNLYTTEDKKELLQLNINNIHHFKNIDKYLCYSNDLSNQDVDVEQNSICNLNFKIYKNFVVNIFNSSNLSNQILEFKSDLTSDFDRSGDIVLINTTERPVIIHYNTVELFRINKQSMYTTSYNYFDHQVDFHSLTTVNIGQEIEVTMTVYNYINSQKNQEFWIEDINQNNIKPYNIENTDIVINSSNKLTIIEQDENKYVIKWFLRPEQKYILRSSNENTDGTFHFNIQIKDNIIPIHRGEFSLRPIPLPTDRNINAFSMTPLLYSSNSHIIDLDFYTNLHSNNTYKLPKTILDIPDRPSVALSLNDGSTMICSRTFNSVKNILDPFKIQNDDVEINENGLYIINDDVEIIFKNNVPLFEIHDMYQAKITYSDEFISKIDGEKYTSKTVIYNCGFRQKSDYCELYFIIPISIKNIYITDIDIFNSKVVQLRFKLKSNQNIKTIQFINTNSNQILYSNAHASFKPIDADSDYVAFPIQQNLINLSYLGDDLNYENFTVNLIPEATYTLNAYDERDTLINNLEIFDTDNNLQYEHWLNTLHIFSDIIQQENKIIVLNSGFSFIPLRTQSHKDNSMFPESIIIDDVFYLNNNEKYTTNSNNYIFIEKYSHNSDIVYMSIQKSIKKTIISIGDTINQEMCYAYFLNDTSVGKKIIYDINIPKSLAFGTFENSINYFEKTDNIQFTTNNIHIEGKIAKIQNNKYQSLFTSENNKFIIEVTNLDTFLTKIGINDNNLNIFTDFPKQNINGHKTETENIYRFIGFAQKNKKLIIKEDNQEINSWSKKLELTQFIFQDGAISNTESLVDVNMTYEKIDYYYIKDVQVDANGYVIDFNPGTEVETVKLQYLVIKVNNEYTFTTIQYTNINPGSIYEPVEGSVFKPTGIEGTVIYKYVNQTSYNLNIVDTTIFDDKQDIGLYFYNNKYFFNFDNIDISTIIPSLQLKLYYYPYGSDTEITYGHKYISVDPKRLEKIKYYNFPYDIDLFDKNFPGDINQVLNSKKNKHSNGIFDDFIANTNDYIKKTTFDNFTLDEIVGVNVIFADKADSSQNLFVHTHKLSTNIEDFRPSLTEYGNEIIPRRIQYITSSDKFLSDTDSTITHPLVQKYNNRSLINFKLTAPHFSSSNDIHKASYCISITKHDIINEFGFLDEETGDNLYKNIDKEEGIVLLNLGDDITYTDEQLRELVQSMRSSGIYIDNQIQILIPHIDYDISIYTPDDPSDPFGEIVSFSLKNIKFSTENVTIFIDFDTKVNLSTEQEETVDATTNTIIQNVQCLLTDNIIKIVRKFPDQAYTDDTDIPFVFQFNDEPYDEVGGIGVAIGQYNFIFEESYEDDVNIRNSIGFVIEDDDAIEVVSGAFAGQSNVNGKIIMHWYDTNYGDSAIPVTIDIKKNFGTISLHSLRKGFMGYENRFHFVAACPAPVPNLTLISLINTIQFPLGYDPYLVFYKQSRDKQKVFDNQYAAFEMIIEDKKGIMNIRSIQILFLQVRLNELTGDYYPDYSFLEEYIAEREYMTFSYYNGYSNTDDIPRLFTEYTNGLEALYVSDTRLKICVNVSLQRYLYDHTMNKIVPYVFINKNKTPILLNELFEDYYIMNVTTNEVVFKIFEGSYAYENSIFEKVDPNEWAWDEANSLILPEGTVNSYYLLLENQGHKDGLFSVSFLLPQFKGNTFDISLTDNIGFTIIRFEQDNATHGNFNINNPGIPQQFNIPPDETDFTQTTPPTNGTMTIELKAGETIAIQYTILRLPEYIPSQDYNQFYKVVDITNFGGTPTTLTPDEFDLS